jgi:hypothetical protein
MEEIRMIQGHFDENKSITGSKKGPAMSEFTDN